MNLAVPSTCYVPSGRTSVQFCTLIYHLKFKLSWHFSSMVLNFWPFLASFKHWNRVFANEQLFPLSVVLWTSFSLNVWFCRSSFRSVFRVSMGAMKAWNLDSKDQIGRNRRCWILRMPTHMKPDLIGSFLTRVIILFLSSFVLSKLLRK